MYRGFIDKNLDAQPVSIRWTETDREFIEKQAHKLGVSFSEFVRWCSYHAANELFKHQHKITGAARKAAEAQAQVNKDEFTDDTQ
jgi:uncharacterized protein (DUF1778 family)